MKLTKKEIRAILTRAANHVRNHGKPEPGIMHLDEADWDAYAIILNAREEVGI